MSMESITTETVDMKALLGLVGSGGGRMSLSASDQAYMMMPSGRSILGESGGGRRGGGGSRHRKYGELAHVERLAILADVDAGLSQGEIAEKFGVKKGQVMNVLRRRAEIVARDEGSGASDHEASGSAGGGASSNKRLKRRRTDFVGLNVAMWRFFCQCRDQGLQLTGRQLKEHAMTVARELGLSKFKGSEGWLDAFKRRHNLDLKRMHGTPVRYEEIEEDEERDAASGETNPAMATAVVAATTSAGICVENLMLPNGNDSMTLSQQQNVHANFMNDSQLAAGVNPASISAFINCQPFRTAGGAAAIASSLKCEDGLQANLAPAPNSWSALMHAANFYNTPSLNIVNDPMFSGAGCSTSSSSSNVNNPINMSIADEAAAQFRNGGDGGGGALDGVDDHQQDTFRRLPPNQALVNIPLLQSLVQTCCVRVDDAELSRAVETIRAFIVANDITMLQKLNELQQALADIQRRKRRQQRQ